MKIVVNTVLFGLLLITATHAQNQSQLATTSAPNANPFNNQDEARANFAVATTLARQSFGKTDVRFLTFDQVSAEKKTTIREDAAIMNHMIGKSLPSPGGSQALGIYYTRSNVSNEIIYDDNGLKFVFRVPLQLVSGDKPADVEEKPKSDWEVAKSELQRQNRSPFGTAVVTAASNKIRHLNQLAYDQDAVTQLDESVQDALDNALNIRGLDSGDQVTVLVYGGGGKPGMEAVKAWQITIDAPGSNGRLSGYRHNTYVEKSTGELIYGTLAPKGVR